MRLAAPLVAMLLAAGGQAVLGQEPPVEPFLVWLCPEHRSHPEEGPGSCAVCGRPRVPRRLASVWSCPMHPQVVRTEGGLCPSCGMTLVGTTRELEWFCTAHLDVVRSEPGRCPRDGRTLAQRSLDMPHGDHNPRHGGILFMAPDGFHHLEGVLGPDGRFRLYLYDDFTRPLSTRGFTARVADQQLEPSADDAFLTLASPEAPPRVVDLTVRVRFPGTEREEIFDFVLGDGAGGRVSAAAGPAPDSPWPTDPKGILEAIRARSRRVDDLVRRGAWPDLFIPALEAKDLALSLLELEGDRVALPVKTVVRAAWLLDLHGDMGRKTEVQAAHRLFAQGVADLERIHER